MKHLVLFTAMLTFGVGFTQVGINTTNPEGTLDVTSINNTGLVLPRVAKLEDVTDGQGNHPVEGTVVYDLSRKKTCFYTNGEWLCIGMNINGEAVVNNEVLADYTNATSTYLKASNTDSLDYFGHSIAFSGDGSTLAIGAIGEDGGSSGINGSQGNSALGNSGAVYLFTQFEGVWSQQAYIKASNTGANDHFGQSISLSDDGNTLVVGANLEDSIATGVNGIEFDNSILESGAAYVFLRTGGNTWLQQAYLKASNTGAFDHFGQSVSLSDDGNTLAIGAEAEQSNATGINGDQSNNTFSEAGAVYLFVRTGNTWLQQAYIKASNTSWGNRFGYSVSLNGDGNYLAVGAYSENTGANGSGAAYVFKRVGGISWSQLAFIKASNPDINDNFGFSISLNDDGNVLAVGAVGEESSAIGVNGDQSNNSSGDSGAVYVFSRINSTWSQDAYIKASNTEAFDRFGWSVSLSGSGNALAVGASSENSSSTGINGDQSNNSMLNAGAVYVFACPSVLWTQNAYVKATNTGAVDLFGSTSSLDDNGKELAIGARREASADTGINGNQNSNSASGAGAVYIYKN